MPRKLPPSPGAWLSEARIDLKWIARTDVDDDLRRRVCYAAQQAAEKALKGVLASVQAKPPKSHHVGELLAIARAHVEVPQAVLAATVLTEFITSSRYPDDYYEPTEAETIEAIDLAHAVVDWAATVIERDT